MNFGDWVLKINCEHPIIETLQVFYKFLVVVLKSPYIQFLSGPPDTSYLQTQIWINIRVGRRIILISLIQPAIICLLKMKNKFIKFK